MPKKKITETAEYELDETKKEEHENTLEEMKRQLLDLGSQQARLSIYRRNFYGQNVYVGSCQPEQISEEYIQKKFGAGTYFIRLSNERGKMITGKTINIEAPVDKENDEKTSQNSEETYATPYPYDGMGQFGMIQAEMQRNHQLTMELIRQMGQAMISSRDAKESRESPTVELATVMQMLKGLQPEQPSVGSVISEAIDVLKKGIELGQTGGIERSWFDYVKEGVAQLPQLIGTLRSQQSAQAQPGEHPMLLEIRKLLTMLKSKALANKDHSLYVDLALDNVDDPRWQPIIAAFIHEPYEKIAEIDPELLNPPYRSWFERVINDIKIALSADEPETNISGQPGDAPSAPGNEAPDA